MNTFDRDLDRKSRLRTGQLTEIKTIQAADPPRPSNVDPIDEMKRRAAARTANPSGAPSALRPTPLPQATEISMKEFEAARRPPPGAAPAPLSRADELAAESLRRSQEASRTASRAAYAQPSAAQGAADTLRNAAGQAADKAKSGLSRLRAMPGQLGRAAAGTVGKAGLAGATIAAAPTVYGTDTAEYEQRLGVGPASGDMSPGQEFARDLGVRAAGAAGDILNTASFGLLGIGDAKAAPPTAAAGGTPAAPTAPAVQFDAPVVPPKGPHQLRHQPGMAVTGADESGLYGQADAGQVIGSYNNRPVTRGEAALRAASLQSISGPAAPAQGDALTSALRALAQGGGGSGFDQQRSRASDINARFDAMAKQIQGLHGSARFSANGSLATKLLRLEEARAQALGQDVGHQVDSQRNLVTDAGSRRNQQSDALSDMVSMRNNDQTNGANLLREQMEAIRARDEAFREQEAKNVESLMNDARARHTNPETGKVDEAAAAAEVDEMLKNAPGLVSGGVSPGDARRAQGEYAYELQLRDLANDGSRIANDELVQFAPGSQLRDPTFGEALSPNSDVTLNDYFYTKLQDWMPGMEEGTIAETTDGRVVRNSRLTESQRRQLLSKLKKARGE